MFSRISEISEFFEIFRISEISKILKFPEFLKIFGHFDRFSWILRNKNFSRLTKNKKSSHVPRPVRRVLRENFRKVGHFQMHIYFFLFVIRGHRGYVNFSPEVGEFSFKHKDTIWTIVVQYAIKNHFS